MFKQKKSAFICRRCGDCCQGHGGIIITLRDIKQLCAYLGMSQDDFSRAYLERINGKMQVRTENGWCVFFAQGCSVHQAKPMVCRVWPFFQGNILDKSSWAMAQDACPGINPEVSHADFVRQGLEHIQNLRCCA